ncbi:MAG: phosphatidate cytidylyltransferase [Pseudobdellovibrionaceae bacterium]
MLSPQLKTRLITAATLIPVVLLVLKINGFLLLAAAVICAALALYEWVGLYRKPTILFAAMGLSILVGFYSLTMICYGPTGFYDGLILFMAVWASDSFAYLFGKKFQGPKMAPTISPNKTWAGLAGAVIGSTLVMAIAYSTSELISHALVVGLLIGLLGQTGDLLESALKRQSGVKDSGALFPGHGGLLDRLDALFFAAPIMLHFHMFINGLPL